jgi:ABC-type lipopolysaccharide export system ATPase subunit
MLDNELGISEKIEGLCFCEILVKDHERMLLTDSGVRFIRSGDDVFEKNCGLDYTKENAEIFQIMGVEDNYDFVMVIIKEKGYEDRNRVFLKDFEVSIDKDMIIN